MMVTVPRNELANVLLKGSSRAGTPDFEAIPRVEFWQVGFFEPGYIVLITLNHVQLVRAGTFLDYSNDADRILEAVR